jgi:hypothetical protein
VDGPWLWLWVTLALLGTAALVGFVVLLARWEVGFSLVLRAETSGAWAFVSGVSLLGLALTLVAAEGVAPHVVVFVLGRRWKSFTLAQLRGFAGTHWERRKRRRARTKPAAAKTPLPWHQRGPETLEAIERWVDPVEAAISLFQEHRRVRLAWMNIDTQFGAEDPTITGQVTGLLYVLDTFLPARVRLLATPDWEPQNRLSLSIQGRLFAWPGRLSLDLCGLVLRALWRRTKYAVGLLPNAPPRALDVAPTEPNTLFLLVFFLETTWPTTFPTSSPRCSTASTASRRARPSSANRSRPATRW